MGALYHPNRFAYNSEIVGLYLTEYDDDDTKRNIQR
jgi:hypothetical protein